MAAFVPFEMERMMSKWENEVKYNLSESGVHPATVEELADNPQMVKDLLMTRLNYAPANGSFELRSNIADMYPGATPENVLVTVGCIEANFIAVQTLLAPGDEMAMMLPNYMQIWGVAHNFGVRVRPFHLREELGWAPDLAELDEAVTERTKLIAVCNPDNPTGYILKRPEMDAVVAAADRVGAWLLADEVYAGAERVTNVQTPSFWGRYDKVLAMGSLSKAYGLPGLRLGWVVGPVDMIDAIWARHEYLTLSATMLANKLAAWALSPRVRSRLIQRARGYIRNGYPILQDWLDAHPGLFSLVPPQAAAIAFPRYNFDINSTHLVERLLREKSVFIVPGDQFGMDHHLRISYGLPPDILQAGLDRVGELLAEL